MMARNIFLYLQGRYSPTLRALLLEILLRKEKTNLNLIFSYLSDLTIC